MRTRDLEHLAGSRERVLVRRGGFRSKAEATVIRVVMRRWLGVTRYFVWVRLVHSGRAVRLRPGQVIGLAVPRPHFASAGRRGTARVRERDRLGEHDSVMDLFLRGTDADRCGEDPLAPHPLPVDRRVAPGQSAARPRTLDEAPPTKPRGMATGVTDLARELA